MEDLPPEPPNLRFLRRLVTVLTATMILGIAAIVVMLFIRFSGQTPEQTGPGLPDNITLPDGANAQAVTFGADWVAVVTLQNEILVFDRVTGALRQSLKIETSQ